MSSENQYVHAEVANNTGANPEVAGALTFVVDAARLAPGDWFHSGDEAMGEGDISASYSADRIAMGHSIRKPFRWQGSD